VHSCVSRCMLLHPGVSVCLQTTEMNVSKPLGCVVPPPPSPTCPNRYLRSVQRRPGCRTSCFLTPQEEVTSSHQKLLHV
jgi:hypothetical protein